MGIKVSMVSLGCSKNQVDAECLLAEVSKAGYELVNEVGISDVVIVNTCGFIQSAKEEAIENIIELGNLKKEGKIKSIILTGCLAQRYKDNIIKEMEEVDAVIGLGSNDKIVETIEKSLNGEKVSSYGAIESLSINGNRIISTLPFYAYLKISEGCNHRCSYCAIPAIRGKYRSRTMEDITKEAIWLCSRGVKEIVIVAQDTTIYGHDIYNKLMLPSLLNELCKIEELKWIRILYTYPDTITDELLDVIASQEKVLNYFDIPIQHCNDEILGLMNRGMKKQKLLDIIKKIRTKIPDVTLRTTLIAGFPTETDKQFEELSEFIGDVKFDRLGCFAYSPEEGTPAGIMDGQIDDEIKEKRVEILMTQQGFIMQTLNEKKIGEELEVLVEGYDKLAECYFGRTRADAPDVDGKVFFDSEKKHTMGDFIIVKIKSVMGYDLIGEEI